MGEAEVIIQMVGPNGFTTTIHRMNVKGREEWLLTLHGDQMGKITQTKTFSLTLFTQKIVYRHFNPNFIATVILKCKMKYRAATDNIISYN